MLLLFAGTGGICSSISTPQDGKEIWILRIVVWDAEQRIVDGSFDEFEIFERDASH